MRSGALSKAFPALLLMAPMVLLASASAAPHETRAQDGIDLTVRHGLKPGEVRLDWTGGAAPFHVYRSTDATDATSPLNELGQTNGTVWLDAPPDVPLLFYAVTGACVPELEVCDGVDNDCDTFVDEGCGTACAGHGDCAPEEHCDGGETCVPDVPDGTMCASAEECASAWCDNGYCCASDTCCASGADCAALDEPAVCEDPSTCQGTRTDGTCSGAFQCSASTVPDDSACTFSILSNDCGPYPPVFCTGAMDQPGDQAALCPTSCANDLECDPVAHCEGSACVPDVGPGEACTDSGDCTTGSCVDGVCCTSDCTGTCAACDLAGAEGTCSLVPDGSDPAAECGALDCTGYYWGFGGDTCYGRAAVTESAATCDGAGACDTESSTCPTSGQGPATLTCDDVCQNPTPSTCTGTTPGACTNVNPGNQTCGLGVCQVSVPQCSNGAPNPCVPNSGAAGPETCNNLDDNCDGTVDNGLPSDGFEYNGTCAAVRTLATVNSNQTRTYSTMTVYGQGDNDFYRIPSSETDSSCSCCDLFCTDEDFRLVITLTVPAGAGSYVFCTGATCSGVNQNCIEVLAGQTQSWTWTLDGACPGQDDYEHFVRIYGDNAPGYECAPYTLRYTFTPGCF